MPQRTTPSHICGLAALAVVALAAFHSRIVTAETAPSVPALFTKYDLIGTFAVDCSAPVSPQNTYDVYRVLGSNHVQADQMVGPTERRSAMLVDRAAESGPNQLTIGGTIDTQRLDIVMRIEEGRRRIMEISTSGKKIIAGGRSTEGGKGVSWYHKCAEKIVIQAPPAVGGKCVDVPYGQFKPGIRPHMWSCNESVPQTFALDASTGRLTIGGLCVESNGDRPGFQLQLAWCNGSPNQSWKTDGSGELVRLLGVNKLCLDIPHYEKGDGAALQLWSCHGGPNQNWQVRPGLQMTFEENVNYDGTAIREVSKSNARACQFECVMDRQCAAWVYRKGAGGSDGKPSCSLRNNITGVQRGGTDDLTTAGRVRPEAQ
jgi:hypothetical protein